MPKPLILIDKPNPHVATFTLNRPAKRNALSIDLLHALHTAIMQISNDPARRVLVLRGAGPAFCAGLDFHEAADQTNTQRSARALCDVYLAILRSPLVTVAAPHGAALGGGAGLVAACDLAIASEDLQLGYPEVRRGLVAALVTVLIRRQVGGRKLREILLFGQPLSAREAQAVGLVTDAVPAESIDRQLQAVTQRLVQGAPGAIARTKRLLNELERVEAELEAALNVHLVARHAAEAEEGIRAFFERRDPRWT